jgi:hypothetical protein
LRRFAYGFGIMPLTARVFDQSGMRIIRRWIPQLLESGGVPASKTSQVAAEVVAMVLVTRTSARFLASLKRGTARRSLYKSQLLWRTLSAGEPSSHPRVRGFLRDVPMRRLSDGVTRFTRWPKSSTSPS